MALWPRSCRAVALRGIREQRLPQESTPLLGSETVRWPGFVEYDDTSVKGVTYCAASRCRSAFLGCLQLAVALFCRAAAVRF
jgi:hypothetical protein